VSDERVSERELIIPALDILARNADVARGVSTRDLARQLRANIQPSAEDLKMLKGRNDDRLSQIIRNLVSHRTLEKQGLAIYRKDQFDGRGYYRLTEMGRRTLEERSGSWHAAMSTNNRLTN
jgi:hypothetical protein